MEDHGGTDLKSVPQAMSFVGPRPMDPDIFLDKIFPVVNNHVEDSPDETIWRVVCKF